MSRSTLIIPLLVFIAIVCLIIPLSIDSDADTTRSSYGVILKVVDQPYFPRGTQWRGFINLTVRNLNTEKSDTFLLECKQKPENWEILILEPTVDVGTSPPTGPEKTTTILVSCPNMEEKGIYTVKIKATSQGDSEQYHTIHIDLEVILVPRALVEGPVNVNEDTDVDPANGIPDYREGDPGDYVTYDFQIRNTGNGEDSYFISLESPNNWWFELQGPSFTQTLDINQTTIKRVKIRIPENAEKKDSDILKFIVTSQHNPDKRYVGEIETEVKQIYMVDLEAPIYTTYSYPLQEVEIDFNVTNKGNGQDNTVRIEMRTIPKGWSYEFGLSRIGENGIPRYGKAPCVLSLVVPGSALNMTYSVTFEAYTSLKQIPDSTITFNITIFQEFSLNLTKEGKTKTILPGDEFSYNFVVENAGNGEDTFSFRLMKVGDNDITISWYSLNTNTVVLGDKLSRDVFLTVKVPKLTKAGEYHIGVEVISLKAEEMQLIVMNTITFKYEVAMQYSLDVAITKGEEVVVINSDEQALEDRGGILHFDVTNMGNTQDIVLFEVDYPNQGGWTSPDFMISRALLQYRESRNNLILNVKAPLKMPLGEYHFTLRIKSDKDPSDNPASDSVDFTVKIVRYDLALNTTLRMNSITISPQDNITVDHQFKVVFKISVKNVGNLDIESFNASLYLNEEKGIPHKTIKVSNFMTRMEKELQFDFDPSNYGTYILIFRIDSDEKISEMNENNNHVELTYIAIEPRAEVIEESAERSIELFGKAYSLLEFVLLILIIIALFLAVAVIFLRVGRKRKKKVLVDTGLVDSGEYRFKERAPTAKFEGLDLDDSFEDMYEEIEEERAKEEIKKDKETGYYVAERTSPVGEGAASGFTVLEESAEPLPTSYSPKEEYNEWETYPSEEEYGEWGVYPTEEEEDLEAEGMFMGGAVEQPVYESAAERPAFGESLSMGDEEEFLLPGERTDNLVAIESDLVETPGTLTEDDAHWDEPMEFEPAGEAIPEEERVHEREDEKKGEKKRKLKEIFSTSHDRETDTIETDDVTVESKNAERENIILTKPPSTIFTRPSEQKQAGPVMTKPVSAKAAMDQGTIHIKPAMKPKTGPLKPSMKPVMKPKTDPTTSGKTITEPAKPAMKPSTKTRTESFKPTMRPMMKPKTEPAKPAMKPATETRTESFKPSMRPMMKPKTELAKPTMKPTTETKIESFKPTMKPKTGSFKPSMKPVMKPRAESSKPSMRPTMKPVVKPKNEKE